MFLSKYWAMICRHMPDTMYLKWQYKHIWHKTLNLRQPQTYAEKLAYMKIHDHDPRLSSLVDKYEVRKYVEKTLGKSYLIPLLGVYDSTDKIPWEALPEKYVLKCTHDSASVVLHQSEVGFDRIAAIQTLNKHLDRNMYWYSREYPYKSVKPRIICEAFLDDHGKPPTDYKVMCFGGKAYYIILDRDRFGNHQRDCYDRNWIKQDLSTDHAQSDTLASKPEKLAELLELAEKLAAGFKHVRVDFYIVENAIFFGEMTFFPWGGPIWFKPDEWNYRLGALIDLNIKDKNNERSNN